MNKKQLVKSSYALLLLCCFSILVYGYFVKPPLKAAHPSEILLPSKAGPVLFTHTLHSRDDGAAIACTDCHHNGSGAENDSSEMKCRNCHYNDKDIVETVCADDTNHPRCIGKKCSTCHDGETCNFCHREKR